MIRREHQKGDAASVAFYSDCKNYRYALTRIWQPEAAKVLFVMLNPSTATEFQNDPTVERCERRTRALGFGGFQVCNIFAWRATDPRQLRKMPDPVGPQNDRMILSATDWADEIICAWGTHGAYLDRGAGVKRLLDATGQPLKHLGLSKAGHPKHPLYIGYAVQPQIWA